MATSITQEQGYTGLSLKIPRVVTTSTLAQVTSAGWWNNNPVSSGQPGLNPQDLIAICHDYGAAAQATSIFDVAIGANGIVTLSLAESSVVLPVVSGHLAEFSGTAGAIADSNIVAANVVVNNSPQVISDSTASATPGTIRALIGSMTNTNTTMTSGNIVGVRGVVNMVGASGGFIYGTQGKVILTGTLSGSEWTAGLFGQVDISAATINAGQIAPIWGDYGSTSHTLTNETGMYGIAMTNTTAAVLAGQLYLYGGATTLMLLNTNSGLSGVTYFKDAGTGSGSWGNATLPIPSKVLTISVDGTLYYLPLVNQNS